jgi:hypothetical protein
MGAAILCDAFALAAAWSALALFWFVALVVALLLGARRSPLTVALIGLASAPRGRSSDRRHP